MAAPHAGARVRAVAVSDAPPAADIYRRSDICHARNKREFTV